MSLLKVLTLICALGFFVASCALPVLKSSSIDKMIITPKRTSSTKQKLCISKITLPKYSSEENILGVARVGIFNSDEYITADKPIKDIMTNFICKSFNTAGFEITDCNKSDKSIEFKFEKLWIEEFADGYNLEYSKSFIKFDIILNDANGKPIWGTTIDKLLLSDKNLIDATNSNIPNFKSNLKQCIEQILNDDSFWDAIEKK